MVLDRTVFYARGGGQPGDTGTLRWEGGEMPGHRHVQVGETGESSRHRWRATLPTCRDAVTAEIDWARRHDDHANAHRLHSLSGVVFADYGAKVTGGNMEPGVARMDFELESISQEFGREVEEKLNTRLPQDRPVSRQLPARAPRRSPTPI